MYLNILCFANANTNISYSCWVSGEEKGTCSHSKRKSSDLLYSSFVYMLLKFISGIFWNNRLYWILSQLPDFRKYINEYKQNQIHNHGNVYHLKFNNLEIEIYDVKTSLGSYQIWKYDGEFSLYNPAKNSLGYINWKRYELQRVFWEIENGKKQVICDLVFVYCFMLLEKMATKCYWSRKMCFWYIF